jgi:hypothetical protein
MTDNDRITLMRLSVRDAVADLLYYDRKNDEELGIEEVSDLLARKIVTIDDMVAWFRAALEEAVPSSTGGGRMNGYLP